MPWLIFQQLDLLWNHLFLFWRDILCGHRPNFGRLIKNLGLFLSQTWVDGLLRWRANDDVEGTYHPMHHKQICDQEDTLEKCKIMGAIYCKQLWITWMKSFLICLFSTHKTFFNPKYYPSDEEVCITMSEQ